MVTHRIPKPYLMITHSIHKPHRQYEGGCGGGDAIKNYVGMVQ